MQAVRQILKVQDRAITIHLPADFVAEEVEVIVLPAPAMENGKPDDKGAAIQYLLAMDTSSFTESQLKAYERALEAVRKGRKPNEPRVFGLFEGLIEIADDFDTLPDEYIDLFYADNIFPPDAQMADGETGKAQR